MRVLVFQEENCPSCGEVLAELESLKDEFPHLHVRVRGLEQEPELTERLGIVATPAMVVNDQLAFQGVPEPEAVRTYFRNVEQGAHDDPEAYPPDDERHPDAKGQEATGSSDPEWRGSGRRPSFGSGSNVGGRH